VQPVTCEAAQESRSWHWSCVGFDAARWVAGNAGLRQTYFTRADHLERALPRYVRLLGLECPGSNGR
jgi:hypothetical protein